MATRIGPKTRKSRRAGIRLFPKDDKIMTKRNYPPGIHGNSRQRISNFGQQLLEKQKAKWMYGLFERQFRNYYERAAVQKGQTGILRLQLLELRLDNVVFRLGFASTRPQARQMVSHGFVEVNGKSVNIPSYQVKVGDTVSIREKKRASKLIQSQKALLSKHKPQGWLKLDASALSGAVIDRPEMGEQEQVLNPQLIIEHYSR